MWKYRTWAKYRLEEAPITQQSKSANRDPSSYILSKCLQVQDKRHMPLVFIGGSKQRTAVAPQAQENPPEGAAQEEDPSPFPDADDPQEKEERSLQTSFLPQEGQAISSSLSEAKTSCSKA
jgi:hypothetical protein